MNGDPVQRYPIRLFAYSGTLGRKRPVRVSGVMLLPDGADWTFEVGLHIAIARARHYGVWRGKGPVRNASIAFRRVPAARPIPTAAA